MAEPTPPLRAALAAARRRLEAGGVAEAPLDARLLLLEAAGLDGTGLILHGDRPLAPHEAARLEGFLVRRLAGEPVGRILGRRAFGLHEFRLSPETLEPRPDTETLVDLAAELLGGRGEGLVFADIGTGTGAIGVSLLARLAGSLCIATDISEGALATARANAGAAGLGARFLPVCADFCQALHPGIAALVSNPPYIPSIDIGALPREVRDHDPRIALDGGADGLDAYRAIAAGAARVLAPGGCALFEIGIGQEDGLDAVMGAAGFRRVAARADLGGVLRALAYARTPSANG